MRQLKAKLVVVVLCLSLLSLGTPARSRYEWYDYQTIWENGSVASITYHYTDANPLIPDWAYAEIFTDEMDIQMMATPSNGLQLLYVWTYDGEFIYPDFPGNPESWFSLGLAPLPGDPPCEGDDCKSCIDQQLAFCYSQAKAAYAVATAAYVLVLAGCAATAVIPIYGPALAIVCATSAAGAYSAAIYKAKTDKKICEYDRPRTYCKHAENGKPCLP
jgi:hypothetical protein